MAGLTLLNGNIVPWDQIENVGEQLGYVQGHAIALLLRDRQGFVEVAVFRDKREAFECSRLLWNAKHRSEDFDLRGHVNTSATQSCGDGGARPGEQMMQGLLQQVFFIANDAATDWYSAYGRGTSGDDPVSIRFRSASSDEQQVLAENLSPAYAAMCLLWIQGVYEDSGLYRGVGQLVDRTKPTTKGF